MDGMLSQEEINALLNGMSFDDDASATGNAVESLLTPEEEDALGEVLAFFGDMPFPSSGGSIIKETVS